MIASRFPTSGILRLFIGVLALGGLSARSQEPVLPGQPDGFYPTYQDTGHGTLLGTWDSDYPRSLGDPLQTPDLDRWAATGGIWPVEQEVGPVADMHRATNWLDYFLRPVTPGEDTLIQGPLQNSYFELGASFPFLSRSAHPEQSTFARLFGDKATQYSPLYFDVLSISAYAIFTDINGPGAVGFHDGFSSALSMDVRGIFRLTRNSSIVVAGQVYFVFTDDADVGLYATAGAPSAFVNFNLEEELGPWDVRVFDNFYPFSPRAIMMEETYNGVVDTTGTLSHGLVDSIDTGNWWDTQDTFVMNSAGFTIGRFLGSSFRFLTGFNRIDRWLWNDINRHDAAEYLSAGIFYDGYDWWVAPSLTYTLRTTDFDDPQHVVSLNATAPITANITANAGFGYSFGDFYDGYYTHLGLVYQQNERLLHTLQYTGGYQNSAIAEEFFGSHLSYGLSYNLGPRTHLGATLGWMNDAETDTDMYDAGVSMTTALGNYTWFRAYVGFLDYSFGNIPHPLGSSTGNTWLYSATLGTQLATRLHGEITAEFIQNDRNDFHRPAGYEEFILMLRLTRTF